MNETKDYVDITPKGVDGAGVAGLKSTVFQDGQIANLVNNPSGLTKEGIEKKIELWASSSNSHQKIFYKTMLARCKNIAPSGLDDAGRVIFSRNPDGTPKWVGNAPKKVDKKK